jgi:DNA-binding NarL/FixJ family response regulator
LPAASHAATRAGIHESLASKGFDVVCEAASAQEAVRLAHAEQPDICLLEAELAGGGIEAASEIAACSPGSAVIVLTAAPGDAELLASLRAGAVGYLPMDIDASRLGDVLHGVVAGEAAVPRRLVSRLIDEVRSQGRRRRLVAPGRPAAQVSNREWEVLELMGQGLSTAEVAERLVVSPVTVRRHASAAARKLGVGDRDAATRLLNGV